MRTTLAARREKCWSPTVIGQRIFLSTIVGPGDVAAGDTVARCRRAGLRLVARDELGSPEYLRRPAVGLLRIVSGDTRGLDLYKHVGEGLVYLLAPTLGGELVVPLVDSG
jgi:hypothetical protein